MPIPLSPITMTPQEQSALRALMAAEPVPGRPVLDTGLLASIERLVPADTAGVVLADNEGYVLAETTLPSLEVDPHAHAGSPYYVGVMHWPYHPEEAEACGVPIDRLADAIAIGFRCGPDHVAQLWLTRVSTAFSPEDLARLQLLTPVLQRLLRERPTPQLPPSLTTQERRVLMHVSVGRSDQEIAEALFIAKATVRKHLENSFRKLGVRSRVAAVAAFQGRPLVDPDLDATLVSGA